VTTKPSYSDKLAYYGLVLLEKPFGLIPTSWIWRIGAGLGYIAHKLAKKRKAIVLANLRIVHPDLPNDQLITLSKEVFRNSFANLASSINTGFISSKRFRKIVNLTGQDNIRKLDPKKGCVLLLFHMGNWELLSRTAPLLDSDKPLGCMFRPLNNPLINEHITSSRERDGSRLFGRKRGLIDASKFLRDGGVLGILADQHSGKAGIKLPLFGKETSITPLPTMLAQKYDCPIIPVTLSTVAAGKWIAHFGEPITIPKELDKIAATKLIIPVMESIMIEHCSDIFWLHDRWKMKHQL
jgi:KDO2-lipid IV(A) lauroyltransferase|tara:strand:+ start:32739 stop:33626 length:888 start_codon:yes stop_codon:yes gene_type:complete